MIPLQSILIKLVPLALFMIKLVPLELKPTVKSELKSKKIWIIVFS